MKNLWEEMQEEAEDIIRGSHCADCIDSYDKGRRSVLMEYAPKVHEMNLALMMEIAMRDDKLKVKK